MKITSDFAILDVKNGREELAEQVKDQRIPITITGYIDDQWGDDDGTSIEFCIAVEGINLKSSYQLSYSVPYEGSTIRDFDSLEEVKDWIRENRIALDDVEDIIQVARSIDVYDLMKDTPA